MALRGAARLAQSTSIAFWFAALVLITLVRNTLELFGLLTGGSNFCCFELRFVSYLNTFVYCLLLLYGGMFMVHGILGGDRAQLRRLMAVSVGFMAPLFVLVPLVNLALNYHGPKIPIWLFRGFYLPAGSLVGFAIILGVLPVVVRRIYPRASLLRVVAALACGFVTILLYTYWLGLWFAFYFYDWYVRTRFGWHLPDTLHIQVYTLTMVLPLLPVFPLWVVRYYPKGERRGAWIAYAVIGLIGAYLVWDVVAHSHRWPFPF